MRFRPVLLFATVATAMVFWLFVRMWWGVHHDVWTISCLLGAWAPLFAAATFEYVRAVGDREHSVLVAWLVRAIGMHFVLVWMLGASDWLRGPPGAAAHWNTDAGAPLVLLMFVPTFALGTLAVRWSLSVARRLADPVVRPMMPGERAAGPMPFRGVPLVVAGMPTARAPIAPFVVGAAACVLASDAASGAAPYMALCAAALALAPLSTRNHRAIGPAVAVLLLVTAVALFPRGAALDPGAAVARGVAWPWLAVVSVGLYLATVEALLRGRRVPGRAAA